MDFDVELFVIGGGSGGVRAARMAAETGVRVALAEQYRLGGTCVIRGCVPKKLLVYASSFADAFEDAAGFGWSVPAPSFDWARLIAAKDAEIARLEGVYGRLLDASGVRVHRCRAVIDGPHAVRLADGAVVRARHILVATGGAPFRPDIPGAERAITSDEAFHLTALPRRVAIVGGGYIACEFAGIFNGLGAHVTQFYRGGQILRGFDDEVRDHVAAAMVARGVDLRIGLDVTAIAEAPGGLALSLSDGGALEVDAVMLATGRRPNTAGLGLETAGLAPGPKGEIAVDRFSQSRTPSIYAVGDVTDRLALTPVAIREGAAFVRTVFMGEPTPVNHDGVATAVFTQPEIGTVGLTEAQARARGAVAIYRAAFRPMLHTLAGREERMLMKLVVDAADQRVLGAHIVGHAAAEMIQMAAIAIGMGATKQDFDRTVAVHPTAAEELVTMRAPVA